jgi:selenocysteine-specific elongation factor
MHIILGTAGHVDHGKTSLVKCLTGIDTDRLKEEKERGITIELGFASLQLSGKMSIGIVDVPGHEKFIKNMVAGAGGIDLVAMVIAADEGVMPQTREHLDICTLLGIRTGLVALTKTDMVDETWLDLVRDDIQEFLKGTFLESAPIVPVSATTGNGLPEFITALEGLISKIHKQDDSGLFRLPIDRIFTMRGFGTVVTGTLISGKVSTGDTINILPDRITAKVRGIQVHNQPAEYAEAGQRTAINLQGIDRSSFARGSVLVHSEIFSPTIRIDVHYRHLPSAPKKLKNRDLIRFHSGTMEIIARIILLDQDEILPGESAFAQIVLESPGVNMTADRFVVRSYSPVRTIGGGVILDPLPRKHKRASDKIHNEMNTLLNGTDMERVSVIMDRGDYRGVNFNELMIRTGLGAGKLHSYLDQILSKRKAILFDKNERRVVSSVLHEDLQDSIISAIKSFQKRFPLKAGISKEELRTAQNNGLDIRLFQLAIRDLEKDGKIVIEKDLVRTTDHVINLQGELEDLRNRIEKIYSDAKLTPPILKELLESLGGGKLSAKDVLKIMLKDGVLIKVTEELYFHRDALNRLRENYRELLLKEGKSTPTSFKELTGLSRKFIIPLIEYFDAVKFTIRVGDHRILRSTGTK